MNSSPHKTMLPEWMRSLKLQAILLFTLLLVMSMLVFTLRVISNETANRGETMKLQAQVLAKNLAVSGAGYLLDRDYASIEYMLLQAMQYPGILGIQLADEKGRLVGDVVRDAEGNLVPRYGGPPLLLPEQKQSLILSTKKHMIVWQPLELGKIMGWLRLTYSLDEIEQAANRIWRINTYTGLVIAILAAVLVVIMLRRPIRTIQKYTAFADSMDECAGDTVEVDGSTRDMYRLGDALNRASSRLNNQSKKIKSSIDELERLAAFAENTPGLLISINENHKLQYINPSCRNMLRKLGLEAGDALKILPPDLNEIIEGVTQDDRILTEIEVGYHGCSISWTFTPVFGQKLLHAYGVDITEKKEAEMQAHDAYAAKVGAEAANKTKSQFLASMSHELRTPLNAVIGYSEILTEEIGDAGLTEFLPDLDKIMHAGKHLLSLINEILDLSKIEAGKMELYLEEIDVKGLVQEVAATVGPLAEKNQNQLKVEFNHDLKLMRADSTKLRQILFNLLSNACKFTRKGDIVLNVDQMTLIGEPAVEITVKDTGIGMSEEQLARVFEPFAQATKNTSSNYGGTGLGLSITKRFTEMMGGHVQVESAPEKGSIFIIQLPQFVQDDAIENYYINRVVNPAMVRFGNNRLERRKSLRKVLIIDADHHALELTERFLLRDGFLVHKTDTGTEGVQLAKTTRPDVIVLDAQVLEMGGWEVLRQLKGDRGLQNIPVVMTSINDERVKAETLGADACLMKPIRATNLSELVRQWVRKTPQHDLLLVSEDNQRGPAISSALHKLGYRVSFAGNLNAVHKVCDSGVPQLIVADLTLPETKGIDLVKALRCIPILKKIPFVALITEPLSEEQHLWLDDIPQLLLHRNKMDCDGLAEQLQVLLRNRKTGLQHHVISQNKPDEDPLLKVV